MTNRITNLTNSKRPTVAALMLVLLSALFYCYEYFLRISPNVMLPQFMEWFQVTASGAGWLASLYYFAYTPLQIGVGVITDRYNPNRTLTWAIMACVAGCFLFPLTHIFSVAAVGRILIGIGSAFAYVGALSIASKTLKSHQFTFFAGAITTMGVLSGWGGDLWMSHILSHTSWVTVLYTGGFIGIALLIAFVIAAKRSERNSPKLIDSKDKTPICFATFRKIFSNRQLILLGVIGALLYLSLSVFAELWGPQFIQSAHHTTLHKASWINGFVFGGWAVGAPCQALIQRWTKSIRWSLIVQSILAAATITVAFMAIHQSEYIVCTLLFLFGFFCSSEVLCFSQSVSMVTRRNTGTAVAVVNFYIMLSGMIFQPLVSKVLELNWSGGIIGNIHAYSTPEFIIALSILPIAAIIAAGLAFFLPKKS